MGAMRGGLRASNWRLPGFGSRETEGGGGENDLEDLENDLAEAERVREGGERL